MFEGRRTALFVGAHPDDLEIGAGGTISKLAASGWDVWLIIATLPVDEHIRERRRKEAIDGASLLGVTDENVVFLEFKDTLLSATGKEVSTLRGALSDNDINPDLVFTHVGRDADVHNDHRACHDIVLAAIRKKTILFFSIPNSEGMSEFEPSVFISIEESLDAKISAMRAHTSQARQIDEAEIAVLNDLKSSERVGLGKVEKYSVLIERGGNDSFELAMQLNDCPFHRFWYTLIGNEQLLLIHGEPVRRNVTKGHWKQDQDRSGIARLKRVMAETSVFRTLPILEMTSQDSEIGVRFSNYHIMLTGGAASNQWIDRYYNHLAGIRYHIDHTMPDYQELRMVDRNKVGELYPVFEDDDYGQEKIIIDYGIISVMRNPENPSKSLIGCMGIHSPGTLGCLKVMTDRRQLASMLQIVPNLEGTIIGYQLLVQMDTRTNEPELMVDSLHVIEECD